MGIIENITSIVFTFGGIVLILLILIRKGESGGLSSAFGGMGGDSVLGVRAQKHLDKLITYVAVFFIAAGILLNTPVMRKSNNPIDPVDSFNQPNDPSGESETESGSGDTSE